MKQIQAYIKPHRLNDVTMALQKMESLRGMTVTDVRGFGRREQKDAACPAVDELIDFAKYVKVEIFCEDSIVDEIVGIINRNAGTGLRGDGKIYVSDVSRAFKIGKGAIL
jgi:nitrogen regulatory protein PII